MSSERESRGSPVTYRPLQAPRACRVRASCACACATWTTSRRAWRRPRSARPCRRTRRPAGCCCAWPPPTPTRPAPPRCASPARRCPCAPWTPAATRCVSPGRPAVRAGSGLFRNLGVFYIPKYVFTEKSLCLYLLLSSTHNTNCTRFETRRPRVLDGRNIYLTKILLLFIEAPSRPGTWRGHLRLLVHGTPERFGGGLPAPGP